MKKILILYASIGLGHKSIAENIGFYLNEAGYEVVLYDAQKVQGGALSKEGKKLYLWILKHVPFIWSWLYNTQWFISLTLPYRNWVASFNYNHILEKIHEDKPDAIMCTHTTASAIVNYLKKKNLYYGALGIAFSDFHLHRYWLYERADFYLANTKEQKEQMLALGVASAKIFVCGMLLKPKPEINVELIRGKFGIKNSAKVILIASGSQGTGIDEALIEKFIGKNEIKVIVACGKNKELFEKLSEKFAGTNAVILGYYSPMDELYAVADIFITKPGGLSVSEALRWGLPMIISHLLPGQEEWNHSYLLKHHLVMDKSADVPAQTLEELSTGRFKKALALNLEHQNLFNGQKDLVEAINTSLKS
jgi:processive 1,2-diacylglycerol beta-glucosyltransferase